MKLKFFFIETRIRCTNDEKPETKYNSHTVNETRREKAQQKQGKKAVYEKMSTEWKFERHTHYKQHEFAEKSK